MSYAQVKLTVLEALRASSLKYTTVIEGFFSDYFGTSRVASHIGPFPKLGYLVFGHP